MSTKDRLVTNRHHSLPYMESKHCMHGIVKGVISVAKYKDIEWRRYITGIYLCGRIKICLTFRIPPRIFSFAFLSRSRFLFICSKLRRMLSSCSRLTPFFSILGRPCSSNRVAFSARDERLPAGHRPAKFSAACGGSSAPVSTTRLGSPWPCRRAL